MFNLEQAISDWRRQMCRAGIKTPAVLQELEGHLRDEIDRQSQTGRSEQTAFELASAHLGRPDLLKAEFHKVERKMMKRIAVVVFGIFAILFGPGMILPALAKHRHSGIWNLDIVWPIVVGTAITLLGIGLTIAGLRKRQNG